MNSWKEDLYDPIITRRRGDNSEPLKSINENLKIINGRVCLTEVPNKFNKVNISGTVDSINYTFYEILDSSSVSIDTTNHICKFKVDYIRGLVDFPLETNGEIFSFSYYGSGATYFPASRVYKSFKINEDGSYDIEQTLEEMIDNYNLHTEDERIANEQTRISNESTRVNAEDIRIYQENARKSAETARINAEAARVSNGALIKSGDTMNGNINFSSDNGIIFGNIKFVFNAGLGTVDIVTV